MYYKGACLALIVALWFEIFTASPVQAQQPLLQITAPANNSLATEGSTITITVAADSSVQIVGVLDDDPLPDVQATSSPTQFTLTLPTTIPPGLYNLTAVGKNASGDVESAPVAIDVEPQFTPTSIAAGPSWIVLNLVGDQMPVRVIGTFGNGSTLDLTSSTQTVYTSNNTQVATVNSSGMITAVGTGQTPITIQAGQSPFNVYAAVMVTVPQQPPSGAPPVITSVSPTNGIPGSTQVTVSGSGFGATQGNGFVQIGTQNAVVSTWSDTQIVATVSAGSANGVVEVDQNGLYSNTVPFTVNAPVIQGITPMIVTSGTQMTITGTGFGSVPALVETANTNGIIDSWSDTQIVITIAQGTGQGEVYVYTGGITSNGVPFTLVPPVITSISPSQQVVPGTQMTLTGTSFGTVPGLVTTANTNGIINSWSDTQIVITVAQGTASGIVSVDKGGVWSNNIPYTIISPVITSISPTQVAPGMQMTITGTGFGSGQGLVPTANTNGIINSWSDTQIVITVAQGTTQGSVYVVSGGGSSNGVPFTTFPAVITSISPTQVTPGAQMTITGTGFGTNAGLVATANTNANVVSWTDTQIVITIVPGTTGGWLYVNCANGTSNGEQFTMVPPVISSISPTAIPLGVPMTITGTHFGVNAGFVATANTNANVLSWSDTQIVITMVPGTVPGWLYVVSSNGTSNGEQFTISTVTLASISITPATASIFQYQSQQYHATGTYSDGSTVDLTSVVTWSSSNTTIATIGSGSTNPGLAVPAQSNYGAVTIGASFGGVNASASLTVQFND